MKLGTMVLSLEELRAPGWGVELDSGVWRGGGSVKEELRKGKIGKSSQGSQSHMGLDWDVAEEGLGMRSVKEAEGKEQVCKGCA